MSLQWFCWNFQSMADTHHSSWCLNLGKWSLKMKLTKVSCNSQLYSEHRTVDTPRAKFPRADAVYNHRDKPRVAQTCFPTEAYIQVAIASPDG